MLKSFVDCSTWRKQSFEKKLALFRQSAPVLDWEMQHGAPRIVVAMGEVTENALNRFFAMKGCFTSRAIRDGSGATGT
jgi:hypothetical protein